MKLFYDIDLPDIGGGAVSPTPSVAPVNAPLNPIVAPAPTKAPSIPITAPILATPPAKSTLIPQPNYKDPASRTAYLKQWADKYGNLEGRGDTIMKLNEVPRAGSDTAKNIAIKAASKYGIDPAILHASAMDEGASGLFKDLSGKDTKGRTADNPNYMDMGYNKDFPIKFESYGLNTFSERYPDLVKKGYLTNDFQKNFTWEGLKSPEAAMQAKAAMMKYHYDDTDSYAKARGIKLSPKARDFFALAEYNGGEGTGHQMMNDYNSNGQLEGDKFLEKRPTTGRGLKETSYKDVYDHVIRRTRMAANLKDQKLFNDK